MTPFLDVVNNWGDFGRRLPNPFHGASFHEAALSGRAESLERWSGSNAYSDREPGYASVSQRAAQIQGARRRIYEARLAEAARIIKRGFSGSKRDLLNLQEAMSISDFPNLFGDVIDRAVLANYLETPYTWNLIAHQAEVSDFRPVKRFRIDGGTGLLAVIQSATDPNPGQLKPLEMGAQYPEDSLTDGLYEYRLAKYGKRMPFFWETFVNDDLNALKDTPARFGRGARRTEEFFVTQLYANNVTGDGPNGYPFYSNGNKNIVNNANVGDSGGNNPALTITALQRAIIVMMQQVDTTGQPISVEAMTLVVPPSLKTVAMNILNTDYVWMADQGGTIATPNNNSAVVQQQLHAMNWAKNVVRLAVNYYLPIVDTTYGHTGWYLFANPESGRPALEFGKLRGHDTPELYMKLPNSVAIGEGAMGPGPGIMPGTTNMNPLEGDFDTDSIHYKIRHVFGGTQIDPIMTVFSNGSGS
jgi:Mu-like prophage major head subunit gpT